MNNPARWKVIAYSLLLFLAGVSVGSMVTQHELGLPPAPIKKKPPERGSELKGPGDFSDFLMHRFKSKLKLTDEQQEKIKPLVDAAALQMQGIRTNTMHQFDQINSDLHAKMAPILTADQQKKLDQMGKDTLEPREHHEGPKRHPPGPPPGAPTDATNHPKDL
jgi:Spy/CpxP family protein refolding chaperone